MCFAYAHSIILNSSAKVLPLSNLHNTYYCVFFSFCALGIPNSS